VNKKKRDCYGVNSYLMKLLASFRKYESFEIFQTINASMSIKIINLPIGEVYGNKNLRKYCESRGVCPRGGQQESSQKIRCFAWSEKQSKLRIYAILSKKILCIDDFCLKRLE
jgi:hypothetical protein